MTEPAESPGCPECNGPMTWDAKAFPVTEAHLTSYVPGWQCNDSKCDGVVRGEPRARARFTTIES